MPTTITPVVNASDDVPTGFTKTQANVDSLTAEKLERDGSIPLTGPMDTGGHPLSGLIVGLARVGLVGGGATKLDGIATVALSLPILALISHATDGIQMWELTAGTSAEDTASGIVRPDDYAAVTNEKIWTQKL